MNGSKNRNCCAGVWNTVRPAMAGLLVSCAVTAGLIAAFSLLFVLLESIAQSAVVPLALLSAGLGCFAGAFICAVMVRRGGLIFGLAIGAMMFLGIFLVGLAGKDGLFGSETVIKLVLLLVCGGAGGYLGSGCRGKRRK